MRIDIILIALIEPLCHKCTTVNNVLSIKKEKKNRKRKIEKKN